MKKIQERSERKLEFRRKKKKTEREKDKDRMEILKGTGSKDRIQIF
jgi:hypothetical protein